MPLVGSMLRRGGAFFIRRSFRDQPLYGAVLRAYLRHMLQHGNAIEFFIEGGPQPHQASCSNRAPGCSQ